MSRAWANGSTPAWRRTRMQVLVRDGFRCRLALPGCTTLATQVHHKVAREIAGDNPAHLAAACEECNKRYGDPRRHDPPPSSTRRAQW